MKKSQFILPLLAILIFTIHAKAQSSVDTATKKSEKKYQAKAPPTQPFSKEAFEPSKTTTIRWLGGNSGCDNVKPTGRLKASYRLIRISINL